MTLKIKLMTLKIKLMTLKKTIMILRKKMMPLNKNKPICYSDQLEIFGITEFKLRCPWGSPQIPRVALESLGGIPWIPGLPMDPWGSPWIPGIALGSLE